VSMILSSPCFFSLLINVNDMQTFCVFIEKSFALFYDRVKVFFFKQENS
jgi:hypothetical protein